MASLDSCFNTNKIVVFERLPAEGNYINSCYITPTSNTYMVLLWCMMVKMQEGSDRLFAHLIRIAL